MHACWEVPIWDPVDRSFLRKHMHTVMSKHTKTCISAVTTLYAIAADGLHQQRLVTGLRRGARKPYALRHVTTTLQYSELPLLTLVSAASLDNSLLQRAGN